MMQLYKLDQFAQQIVLDALEREPKSLNQGYKIRMTVAYGLERFWGESLRLQREPANAAYWRQTWDALVEILGTAGLPIPNEKPQANDVAQIQSMAESLWSIPLEDQRVAIAVLTQLCDSIVWWTQRYKGTRQTEEE